MSKSHFARFFDREKLTILTASSCSFPSAPSLAHVDYHTRVNAHQQRRRLGREQDRIREHVHVGAKHVQEGRHVRIDALCTTHTIVRAHA